MFDCVSQGAPTLDQVTNFRFLQAASQVWSVEDCEFVLGAVKEAVASRQEGWTTDRHAAYATTDVPCSEIPSVNTWVRESLTQRVFPELLSSYTRNRVLCCPFWKMVYALAIAPDLNIILVCELVLPSASSTPSPQDTFNLNQSMALRLAKRHGWRLDNLYFRDLFFVKYSVAGQAGLALHRDGSVVSFNLLQLVKVNLDRGLAISPSDRPLDSTPVALGF